MKFLFFCSSSDRGRISLSNSTGHECNIKLSKAAKKDEGNWYFHIIHGSRLDIQWYFHKVFVNVKTRRVVGQIRNQDEPGKAMHVFGHQKTQIFSIVLITVNQYMNQQFVNKLSLIPSDVAELNASSALVVIGVVCALVLIVAVVVIVKRRSKNNIEDKEVPGS